MVDASATAETSGAVIAINPEALRRQQVLGSQKDSLRQAIIGDIHPTNKARAVFLSDMASKFLEDKSLADLGSSLPADELSEAVDGRRQLILTGLNLKHDPQLTWPTFDLERAVDRVAKAQKMTPEQTALVIESYILDELCYSPKAAFDAMKMLVARTGQSREQVIEGFRPYIEQVRETGKAAEGKRIEGTLRTDEYPFHTWPSEYVEGMDNLMRLKGNYLPYDDKTGHYKRPQEEKGQAA